MGRIRSLDRYVEIVPKNGRTYKQFRKGKILIPRRYDKTGHVAVLLEGVNKKVHQLVLRTFVGEPLKGQEVRHKNGIPNDNRLENLEYGTSSENTRDIYRQGKRWWKLNLEEVRKIKRLLEKGENPKKIAKIYDISLWHVWAIRKGERYSWVK